ncbi:hypothetical protein FQ087_04100 [Sporosarcina sp. ANT_H38]|uniref:hypothetical protein n=1 Tax=Sporosarcina sp. ANT_H38 TaxID=2597358 RepID=UPI0011F388CA|nr:hypothetical protein [Sporosarcina sp. ANT_H38]KAA0965494.1 hypothetical protein FQ087_04100 [Sporosarcina sp. ANT_H38]
METTLNKMLLCEKMSIIASLPENRIDLAQAAIDAGVDGLKFHINVSHRASGNEFKDVAYYLEMFGEVRRKFSGPIGLVIGDEIEKVLGTNTKQLKELGFNYYSLYAKDIGSKMLLQNDLERTVAVNDKFCIEKVRMIESFNIQAVELSIVKKEDYGSPLNFEDLITYKSYRDNTKLPLIVPSQKNLVPDDMVILQEIGINAVMLGAVTIGSTVESIFEKISRFTKK